MANVAPVPEVMLNPFEPGFFDDPYAQYAVLRDHEPVHFSPLGVWILFRYDDCFSLLRDPNTSVDIANVVDGDNQRARTQLFEEVLGEDFERRDNRGILFVDPPDHTRLRRLVSKVFTPRRVEELRPLVQQIVDGMLDDMADRAAAGEVVDVIGELAFPLPFTVISEMLGMPDADRDELRAWSGKMVKLLDPILSPDELRTALEAGQHMFAHVTDVIAWKREHLTDDLLSALITAEDEGDMLTEQELVDQVVLLFVAGHETTVNLIGNGTRALLRNRAQLEVLQGDPALDVNAIDELLRFDSPVQFSRRISTRELDVGGVRIESHQFVMTCVGSANRDPAMFGDDADQLDVRRPTASRHVSFGSGVHHCLGAALARMEGQVAIGSLVRRFPQLELATDEARWNGRIVLRGLDELSVALGG